MKKLLAPANTPDSIDDMKTRYAPGVEVIDLRSGVAAKCGDRAIAVVSETDPKNLISLAVSCQARSFVQYGTPRFEKSVAFGAQMLTNPSAILDDPVSACIGRSSFLYREEFWESSEKRNLLGELKHILTGAHGTRSMADVICLAGDELFTNAVFNAPVEDQGQKLSRTRKVVSPKPATLLVAANPEEIFVACIDQFGSLNPAKVFARFKECFDLGTLKAINQGEGGAGTGLKMIFEMAPVMFIVVEEGRRTLVGCKFLAGQGQKANQLAPKDLHSIQYKAK